MKIRTMVVILALSFTTAVFSFAQDEASPTPAPDAQKKEVDKSSMTPAAEQAAPAMAKPADAKKPAAAAKAATSSKPAAATAKMAAPTSPQMGTWMLDEGKSKLTPGTGKNTKVVYSAAKEMTKVTVEGVDKDGKKMKSVWMGKFDGKSYPVKGNPAYDAASYKMVNPQRNDITTTKGGKVAWTGKIVVAKDGKSRVVTVNGKDAAGKKWKTVAVYNKAK